MLNLLFDFEVDRLFTWLAKRRVHQDKFMNEFILLSLFFSVNMCLNVPPPPSLTFTRSETLEKHLHIDLPNILILFLLCMCLSILSLSNINLNCRFISFDTRLNTLTRKPIKNADHHFLLLFLSYVIIFEYYFIIFLPYDFYNVHLDITPTVKYLNLIVKIFNCGVANTTSGVCHRLTCLGYISIVCFCSYPLETIAIWIFLMRLVLCPDIHPNPGPAHSNDFTGGFFSFCNWNLNTLSKEDFSRITLLEAHNTEHKYDIISLCETSLDNATQVPETPGYKFHLCNHPDGNRSVGVGIFYKESLPLKIREDLSFNECIVCELIFGHKHIFFAVLYRNPQNKVNSDGFNVFF